MDPLVTIAIPSYNYARYLGEAIRSALDQTYRNIEVLVLDNASTDDSVAVARSFQDERLRVVVHPENLGLARNHNECLRQARGELVSILSSDDRLMPTYVDDVLAFRRANPQIDVVYTTVAISDASGQIEQYFEQPSFDGALAYWGRNELASLLTRDNNMYITTTLVPRKIFDEIGYLDESLEVLLDYEFDLRMAAAGKRFAFACKPEAIIRFHGNNRSGVNRFVKTGNQLREFCSIVKRYVVPENYGALTGYNAELGAMIGNKVNEIAAPFPDEFARQRADLEPRVAAALDAVSRVPAISQATLRGEPLISVVIPHSGRIGPLQRALASLAGQSYGKWEAVLVADNAPDPAPLVRTLGLEDRVRVAHGSRRSFGPAGTRNIGLGCVNGELVAYLDDDNRFELGYFAALAKAFADPTIAATAGRTRVAVVEPNGDVGEVADTGLGLLADGTVSAIANRLPLNAVAHRRSCLGQIGRFNAGLPIFEDWDFLLRLNRGYRIAPLDAPACIVCLDTNLTGHAVFGRKNSAEWSDYAQRLHLVYNAVPPRSQFDQHARDAYVRDLQAVVQNGVNAAGNPRGVIAFARALAGPAATDGRVAV